MTVTRRTRVQWRQLIQDWQASGVSITSFCARQNLSESNFYYWRKRLQFDSKTEPHELPTWIALGNEADSEPQPTWEMELSLPGGAVLRIRRA